VKRESVYALHWEAFRPIERTAIVDSLDPKIFFRDTSKTWDQIEPQVKEQLMKIDWEFCLGRKLEGFPQ
jgi:hypothetical protein